MGFVLILFIVGQGGFTGHTGLAMHNFNTRDSCEAAGQAARAKWRSAEWVCASQARGTTE